MYNISNKSSRITPPEGYTEIPIEWGDGEKLYVYINPNETSQTVYIGSDKNYKSTERSKVITFETNNESGATSRANLNVIQAATSVNTVRYFWEYNLNGEITSQEIENSNTINLPMSTSSGDNLTLKIYAQATINEREEIRTYLPLTIVSQSPTSSKIHVSVQDTETLKITVDDPQDQTSDTINLTINGGENGNYYWDKLGISIGLLRIPFNFIQAANESTGFNIQNFVVNLDNDDYEDNFSLVTSRMGSTLSYSASYDLVTTYDSGYIKTTHYDSKTNPEYFDISFEKDSSAPNISWSNTNISIPKKTNITWGETLLGILKFTATPQDANNVTKLLQITLSQQTNKFTINSYYSGFANKQIVFANKSNNKTLPNLEINENQGMLNMAASGGTYSIKQATIPFNVTTEVGDSLKLAFIISNYTELSWGVISGSLSGSTLNNIPIEINITDMQGEGSVTGGGGSVTINSITALSLGSKLYPQGKGLGTINLYMVDTETPNDEFYHLATVDIEYEPNVLKTTSVKSFNYTYPELPAQGHNSLSFDEFSLIVDGTWTSGESSTNLDVLESSSAGLSSMRNTFLLPNFGIQMFYDELVPNYHYDGIPEDMIDGIQELLMPAVDRGDTFNLTVNKRVYENKPLITKGIEEMFDITIGIKNANGDIIFNDSWTSLSLSPNRIFVDTYSDLHWIDSWNTEGAIMYATGGDVTKQVMKSMSVLLQVAFESSGNPGVTTAGLTLMGSTLDGTNAFINLDCMVDSNQKYDQVEIPLSWWSVTKGTYPNTPGNPFMSHKNPLDSYIESTDIANGFKAKNLKTTTKTDDSTSFNIYYPEGLLIVGGIRAISLKIPLMNNPDNSSVVGSLLTELTITDDMGIQDRWDKYLNIPWQANTSKSWSDKNCLMPTYYNPISKMWLSGFTYKNVDKANIESFPYKVYISKTLMGNPKNRPYALKIVMPKEGGTIYLLDFTKVSSLYQSTFLDVYLDSSSEEVGNSFAWLNPSEQPDLSIIKTGGPSANKSAFGIVVPANTSGSYKKYGYTINSGTTIRLVNNNDSNIGHGTVVEIQIEQEG